MELSFYRTFYASEVTEETHDQKPEHRRDETLDFVS